MPDRRSELDSYDIRGRLEELRKAEGRTLVRHPVAIVMLPAADAPRGVTGMVRLRPHPDVVVPPVVPRFSWGKICKDCPLTKCSCYPSIPTHWGEVPSELM